MKNLQKLSVLLAGTSLNELPNVVFVHRKMVVRVGNNKPSAYKAIVEQPESYINSGAKLVRFGIITEQEVRERTAIMPNRKHPNAGDTIEEQNHGRPEYLTLATLIKDEKLWMKFARGTSVEKVSEAFFGPYVEEKEPFAFRGE